MTRIITITLNPALDIHYGVPHFEIGRENYSSSCIVNAGGKGVNVSAALTANGVPNLAVIAVGRANYQEFVSFLDKDNIRHCVVLCEGSVRRNITIHHDGGTETRLSQDGFCISLDTLEQVRTKISKFITSGSIIVFSGRVPKGISVPVIKQFLFSLQVKGALLVIDSNSFSLTDLIELKPWLVKPNEHEIELLVQRKVNEVAQACQVAKDIQSKGIEHVLITLGANGMAYAGVDSSYLVKVPKITPISTIGAGDSTIAGFIEGYTQGLSVTETLKNAAAFGTAACLTEGTNPPTKQEIAEIKEEIWVR